MMKRIVALFLMVTLLAGATVMGQTRTRHKSAAKAKQRTESVSKKQVSKVKSEKVKGVESQKVDAHRVSQDAPLVNQTLDSDAALAPVVGDMNGERPQPRLDGDVVFKQVDQMPEFPGGLEGLSQFLSENIVYPPVAYDNNVEGRVLVQFVVEKDGSVGEIKILRSVEVNLDYEAIRLCKILPKFKPGMVDGKPVRVWYTLPITFKLNED